MRLASATLFVFALAVSAASAGPKLLEPDLHVDKSGKPAAIRVAVTFDACEGRTDDRILSTLVENHIPATIFITAKWLKRNSVAFETMRAHPELFELEDHGARHIPAVDVPVKVYGISSAGSPEAVTAEVQGGSDALVAAGAAAPKWFRGATAKYTPTSLALIRRLGFKVAGYSVNADGGSLFGAGLTERQFARAADGDVIIAHINQPTHKAGEGVVKGLLDLKKKGATFVKLDDGIETGSDDTTN
jgi:peptidoglycan/xylan/chitin deacetylase (PgdA/CDA1 family)